MLLAVTSFFVLSLSSLGFLVLGTFAGNTIAVSIVPSIICLVGIIISRTSDYFSPLWMLFYMAFIGSFLKAYYLFYLDHDGEAQRVLLANLELDILMPGAIVLTLGILSAVVGCLLIPTSKQIPVPTVSLPEFDLSSTRIFGLLSLFIGTIMFIWFFNSLNLWEEISKGVLSAKRLHKETLGVAPRGAALGYLRMGAQTLPQVAFLLHATNFIVRRQWPGKTDFTLLISLALLSLLLPFFTSSRLEMLYLFVFLLINFHYGLKRVSILNGAIVAVILVVVLTTLGQLRQQSHERYSGDRGINLSIEKIMQATLARGYFMGIDKTSVIVDAVPERVDYLNGKSLVLFLLGPIPRTWWPEKPVVRIGLFVGQEILQRDNDSGTPPGYIGELYLNYGHLAVTIGMFVFGLIYGLLYRLTIVPKLKIMGVIIYSIGTLFMSFTLLTGDVTIFMSQLFRYGLCFLFAVTVIRFHARKIRATQKLSYPKS